MREYDPAKLLVDLDGTLILSGTRSIIERPGAQELLDFIISSGWNHLVICTHASPDRVTEFFNNSLILSGYFKLGEVIYVDPSYCKDPRANNSNVIIDDHTARYPLRENRAYHVVEVPSFFIGDGERIINDGVEWVGMVKTQLNKIRDRR